MDDLETIESIRALLGEIVDYAGLFPPAQLPMAEAVANYAKYLDSSYRWMLGRFVLPVARLAEFADSAKQFIEAGGDVWRLSALAGGDIIETVESIAAFNIEFAGQAVIDALEVKADDISEIEHIAAHLPKNLAVYFELPPDERLVDSVIALAIHKHRAKLRTGGVTPYAFPSVDKITRFIRICLAANVPFKCTAGLHHPLRSLRPLTYQPDSLTTKMNGFLNVFLAAAFLQQGYEPRLINELLKDDRADSFQFRADGVLWRQEYFAHTTQLRFLRERAVSFGSCSFTEPIEDLQEIGLL